MCCIATTIAIIHIQIYVEIWSNIMTNFNERMNILLYENISLTLYSRKGLMLVVCERWVGGGDRLLFWPKVLLSTITALLSHSGWAAQPWVTVSPKPSVCHWLSIRHLVPNWLQLQLELTQTICGTWLYNCLMPTYFCCSSAYLHRCISWLTAQSRVNI